MPKNDKKLNITFYPKHKKELDKLGVEIVYLYGSYAQGIARPNSDIDLGVVFRDPEKYRDNTLKAYNKLHDLFYDILKKEDLDIVFLQLTSFKLQFNAISKGQVVYEKNKQERFSYEEYVVSRNADLKYFYDLSFKYLMQRI